MVLFSCGRHTVTRRRVSAAQIIVARACNRELRFPRPLRSSGRVRDEIRRRRTALAVARTLGRGRALHRRGITNRWTGATGGVFRIKSDPAKVLDSAVARSTPPLCAYLVSNS